MHFFKKKKKSLVSVCVHAGACLCACACVHEVGGERYLAMMPTFLSRLFSVSGDCLQMAFESLGRAWVERGLLMTRIARGT